MAQITDAERQRRSEAAKELVAAGKIGGPRPGSGRPRKQRAAEKVAEKAREEADLIVSAFVDTLKDEKAPHAVKVNAAKEWLTIENKEAELRRKEEKDLEEMGKGELVAGLLEFFQENKDIINLPAGDVEEVSLDETELAA